VDGCERGSKRKRKSNFQEKTTSWASAKKTSWTLEKTRKDTSAAPTIRKKTVATVRKKKGRDEGGGGTECPGRTPKNEKKGGRPECMEGVPFKNRATKF